LVKTSGSGNAQWNKTYGGTGAEIAYSVVQTNDGGYALAGTSARFFHKNYELVACYLIVRKGEGFG
jgi:hypothetical protein